MINELEYFEICMRQTKIKNCLTFFYLKAISIIIVGGYKKKKYVRLITFYFF
jgi:hypothetical protein